jgi:hypothetical protein
MSSFRISALLGIPEGAGIYGEPPAYSPRVADSLSAMLDDLITPQVLYQWPGAAAFRRGEAYFSEDAVGDLASDDESITARVQGTETYRIELIDDDGELAYDCDCPRAADGFFCKHCVAAGLAWLTDRARAADSGRRSDPWSPIRDYLAAQPAAVLIQLVLDAARRDEGLFQSLLLKARRGGDAAAGLREAIDRATTLRGHGGWAGVGDDADGIERVVEALADLLAPGRRPCWSIWPNMPSSECSPCWNRWMKKGRSTRFWKTCAVCIWRLASRRPRRRMMPSLSTGAWCPPSSSRPTTRHMPRPPGLIRRIGVLLKTRQQAPEFVDNLIALRARYEAKRNLMKLLEGVAWARWQVSLPRRDLRGTSSNRGSLPMIMPSEPNMPGHPCH